MGRFACIMKNRFYLTYYLSPINPLGYNFLTGLDCTTCVFSRETANTNLHRPHIQVVPCSVKPTHVVNSIKQSSALKCHLFLVLS
jgi:hypothetical protein